MCSKMFALLVLSIHVLTSTVQSAGMRGTGSIAQTLKTLTVSGSNDGVVSSGFEGYPGDDACVSVFPDLCKFLDELPLPTVIDVSHGDLLTLGAYNIKHSLHSHLPDSSMYGYGETQDTASVPGPTLLARRNILARVQWENHLQDFDFALPEVLLPLVTNGSIPISMHLHGGETEPSSDGHAEAWFTATGERGSKYVKSIHTYHNGQPPATLWYHDHTFGMTAHNVYFGLAGFYVVKDPENTEKEFDLPTSEFDIPLLIQNKQIEESGKLHESLGVDQDNAVVTAGFMTVNGKAWPYFHVSKTLYRFRLLNGANLLLLNVSFLLVDQPKKNASATGLNWVIPYGKLLDFKQIACDGGYLNEPYTTNIVQMGPAERTEVLVDFSEIADSSEAVEVLLINSGDLSTDVNGIPEDSNLGILAKFIIDPTAKSYPVPAIPTKLNNIPNPTTVRAVKTRWVTLTEMQNGVDRIHLLGMHRYAHEPTEIIREGSTEVWAIVNLTPQTHTIHLHAVKFQLISRQLFDIDLYTYDNCSFLNPQESTSCFTGPLRKPMSGSEQGWKDTILVQGYDVTMIVFSATSQDNEWFPFNPTEFPGYVWHCHMTEHEDEEMMRPFMISAPVQERQYDTILEHNDYPDLTLVDPDDK